MGGGMGMGIGGGGGGAWMKCGGSDVKPLGGSGIPEKSGAPPYIGIEGAGGSE